MAKKGSCTTHIGLILSFIGMAGLALTIISLLPVNVYNIYTTVITSRQLLQFEHDRTGQGWQNMILSDKAKLYLTFLIGSTIASVLEIVTTLCACSQSCTNSSGNGDDDNEEGFLLPNNRQRIGHKRRAEGKSWFIRLLCLTILIQITFSLLGAHLLYKVENDPGVIPLEIQANSYLSCLILWINYLSCTLFAFVLLFASFLILIGAYRENQQRQQQERSEAVEIDEESLLLRS